MHRHIAPKAKCVSLWAAMAMVLAACAAASSSVPQDLVTYVNQGILGIAGVEAEALAAYAGVTGANFTSEKNVLDTLQKKVIPRYGEFLQLLRQVRFETDEVARLHQIYLVGAETMEKGFRAKALGLETHNDSLVAIANQTIEAGRLENEKWREALIQMYAKHGVTQEDETPKK